MESGCALVAVSDEDLVSQAQAGSAEAFDELVSRHQERVYALAWRVLGNPEDAADVQQETFVRAWVHLQRSVEETAEVVGRPVGSVRTQLHRARKVFRQLMREHLGEDTP